MLQKLLSKYTIVLASGSPRRQAFFKELEIPVKIDVRKVDEVYPKHLQKEEITNYLAQLKAKAFTSIEDNTIVITSDTIVWHKGKALEKPKNEEEAYEMLQTLSGKKHKVITSVCFTNKHFQKTLHSTTKVWVKPLLDSEIKHYIQHYNPYDKAGSYGIQEWFGYIAISKIKGSFFNVMGLPTHLVYKTLLDIAVPKANTLKKR